MLILPRHNLRLIDFSGIFKEKIEAKVLNDLDSYGLIKNDIINVKNRDVKKVLYHTIIHELCEYVLSVKGDEKVIVVYSTITPPTVNLHECAPDFMSFLNKFIKRVSNMLPIQILHIDSSFDVIEDIMEMKSGECAEIINNAKILANEFDIGSFTFTKARYFAKKYELEYLSNNYFKQIKSKQLIFS